ncbi:hypothetical protein B0H14DRAFT_2497590 [Mycena olivaceomarginata]|nr:hypothetical protein B0H14DRAFT_2497590 [Mycena olivaceomarginata]
MAPPPGGGRSGVSGVMQVVYTDDATTRLSDRVRRRCFNCRATKYKTWRRSILSPGKVLCNKCGLFERSHSRSRPEQIFRLRSSPQNLAQPTYQTTPQYAPPTPAVAAPTASPNADRTLSSSAPALDPSPQSNSASAP